MLFNPYDSQDDRSAALPTQRGRKLRKIGGTFQPFSPVPPIGPPPQTTQPLLARQPKGPYEAVPNVVVDRRPAVIQRPISSAARNLLVTYYRLSGFSKAVEERVPIDWIGERLLGVRKARAYQYQREIAEAGDVRNWFRQKALTSMKNGRIARGRETRSSRVADAFFIALAGGEAEARKCALSLAGNAHADLQSAAANDRDVIAAEVRDYVVHSRLLWRLGKKTD